MKTIKRIWQTIKQIRLAWKAKEPDLFPPGYAYKAEISGSSALLGVGIGLSFQFFEKLANARDEVLIYVTYFSNGVGPGKWMWKDGAIAKPFTELADGYLWLFLPWLIFVMVTMILHYTYYRGNRSIYVMRRLNSRRPLIKSCLAGMVYQLVTGAVIILLWFLLLFVVYMCALPDMSNPGFI